MDNTQKCFEQIESEVLAYYKQHEQDAISARKKGALGEIVTEHDQAIEKIIIKCIRQYFTDHNIFGEETGVHDKDSQHTWHIDPIDNTVGYIAGESEISTSIALKEEQDYVRSLVINPRTGEVFTAFNDQSLKNNTHISTFSGKLEDKTGGISLCSYVNPVNLDRWKSTLSKFAQGRYPLRMSGGAALDLCRIAEGIRLAHVSFGAHSWDVEAGMHIVQNAGGVVEILKEFPERNSLAFIASANRDVHTSLKDILSSDIKF